jgi:hypothetical protein
VRPVRTRERDNAQGDADMDVSRIDTCYEFLRGIGTENQHEKKDTVSSVCSVAPELSWKHSHHHHLTGEGD